MGDSRFCIATSGRQLQRTDTLSMTPWAARALSGFQLHDGFATHWFKRIGMPDSFTLRETHDLASTVCQGQEAWDVFGSVASANAPGAIWVHVHGSFHVTLNSVIH